MGDNPQDSEFEGQGCYQWDIITGANSSGYEELSVPEELRSSTHKTAHGFEAARTKNSTDAGAPTPLDQNIQPQPTPEKFPWKRMRITGPKW